ncbi:MAG TPA: CHAT domain-containing protein, partial [Aggregatilineaceae bacterium]|nr:CHAT domain-containing protein [Aggregatilineaceae bacterium]
TREITRGLERQRQIHSDFKNNRLVIDMLSLPQKITVLFLAANPKDQEQLYLDEEIRAITEKIRASEYRDSVELISRWAVRPDDLLQALNEHRPHIIHISGHGSYDGIAFSDPSGNTQEITMDAIVQLFKVMSDNVRVVVFNTCCSRDQAEAVVKYVDVAIGMNAPIDDELARIFAAAFYSAIGFGHSVEKAFEQARVRLMMENRLAESIPELFSCEGIDPDEVILVRPLGLDEQGDTWPQS